MNNMSDFIKFGDIDIINDLISKEHETVFNQEYEGFGSTIIVQGNDGINYYYTNLTNITVNLYDYLDKDTLIGVTNEDYLYLILEKNGEYVSYESLLQ